MMINWFGNHHLIQAFSLDPFQITIYTPISVTWLIAMYLTLVGCSLFLPIIFFPPNICLCIWLHWVLVVTCRIFEHHCGMWDLILVAAYELLAVTCRI